jgi:hypothetical protein
VRVVAHAASVAPQALRGPGKRCRERRELGLDLDEARVIDDRRCHRGLDAREQVEQEAGPDRLGVERPAGGIREQEVGAVLLGAHELLRRGPCGTTFEPEGVVAARRSLLASIGAKRERWGAERGRGGRSCRPDPQRTTALGR